MVVNHCVGNPTFNEITAGAFSEWPENLPGYICKTPPFGIYSAPRFAECCSGTVYNITSPTSPDEPAYPVSCATLCQVDPALDKSNNKYPYHWSDYFMCLIDGDNTDSSNSSIGDVVCDTVTVKGELAPTSFPHTPTGPWETQSYAIDSWGFPLPTTVPVLSSVKSEITSTSSNPVIPTATTPLSDTKSPSESASLSITLTPSSSSTGALGAPATTISTSNGERLALKNPATALLIASVFCVRLGSL